MIPAETQTTVSRWSTAGRYDVAKYYARLDEMTRLLTGDPVAIATYSGYGGA